MGNVDSALSLMNNIVVNNVANLCHESMYDTKFEKVETYRWALNSAFNTRETQPYVIYNSNSVPCTHKLVSRNFKDTGKGFKAIALAGEVFEGPIHLGDGVDILLDRTTDRPVHCKNCQRVHYYQGLGYAATHATDTGYDLHKLCHPEFRPLPKNNSKVLLSASRVAKRSHHSADVLFRVAVFKNISSAEGTKFVDELKDPQYTRVKCPGNFLGDMVKCKSKYQFTLDMENSQHEGYVSEKLFTGLLAGTIPVYFGDPGITKIINPRRIIQCKLDPEKVNLVRKTMKLRGQDVLKNLAKFERMFSREIHECSNKIKTADVESILNQPVFTNPTKMCRNYPYSWDVGEQLNRLI